MDSPRLMLLKIGRRYRVVVVGDNRRGKDKGYTRVPGQPHAGLTRADALELARTADLSGIADVTGSYVSPAIRERLEEIAQPAPSAPRGPAPAPAQPAPARTHAEGLIARRRAALEELAKADAEIARLLGPEGVDVVSHGMEATVH